MKYQLHVRQSDDPVTFRMYREFQNSEEAKRSAFRWCESRYRDQWKQANEAQFVLKHYEWNQPFVLAFIVKVLDRTECLKEERTRLIMRLAEIEKELSGGNQ